MQGYYNMFSNDSQAEVVIAICTRVSQLSAHSCSLIATKEVITHSAPLSIAVYLHQTLVDSVPSSKTNLAIIRVTPNPCGIYVQ